MTSNRVHPLMGSFFIVILLTISSAHADLTLKVTETSSGEFIGAKKDPIQFEADKPISLELSAPLQISSETRVPVFLIPVYSSNSEITVNSPLIKNAVGSANQNEVSNLLSTLMTEIDDIQNLIKQNKLNEALGRVQALRTQYPQVKFLEFVRASILLLQGNRAEATQAATEGAKAHPNYQGGKRFLEKLKGSTR